MALLLPVREGVVRLEPGEQQSLDSLLRVLRAEAAPISTWTHAAQHLLAAGRDGDYEAVMSEAVDRQAPGGDTFSHVLALCSLAEFTAQRAVADRDRRSRALLLSRSSELCLRAQRLSGGAQEQLPELVLAHVALIKGDTVAARKGFENAARMRCNGRPSIAAQLALANLQFNQRNYADALRLYKQAVRDCPSCPPEVRLGIAACCLKLGNTEKAELAYRRTLELSPNCTPALLGLAVLKLHVSSDEEGVREGSQLLAQAFEQDPENPFVLLLLAHFCLRQGYAEKALQAAQIVYQHAPSLQLQGEALTILARAHHALGRMQEAFTFYQQANQLDSKLPLPKLGLAQVEVLRGQPINAVSILESVLLDVPQWIDALQVLGRVLPKTPLKSTKVVPQFKEATEQRPQDADLWELLGDLLSSLEPAGALKAYNKAIEIKRAAAAGNGSANGGAQLPARLLNNAAVLHLRAGNSQAAYDLMAQAMQTAADAGLGNLSPLAQVTLGYNLARVKEACGSLQAAEAEYKELLKQFPQYGDCCLRLACIAKARGDTKEALRWTEQAVDIPAYCSDALALQAGLYLEKRDYHRAKQVLDRLLEQADSRHETFAKLAMANLHAYSAPSDRRKEEAIKRAEVHYSHAMELYRRVLEKDEGCISAANGVGCILAEVGNMSAAKEVFLQVQEASAATDGFWRMPDAWINLANVYLAQQQYVPAIQMYKNALRKFYDNRSALVMLYLARAQYDADQLPEAKATLTKALHLAPTDHKLRFDVAVTLQEWAVRTLNKERPPGDPGKYAEMKQAMRELQHAHRFFLHLKQLGRAAGLDPKKLQHHVEFVVETHDKSLKYLEAARHESEQAALRQQMATMQAEAARRERELAAKNQLAREEAAKRRLEEQARRNAEKLQQMKDRWKTQATVQKAVEQGDAAQAAKAVEKSKQAAAAAEQGDEYNNLFDESEEDEDYVPGMAEDEQEAAAARQGGAAAGVNFQDLEDEFDDDFDLDEGGASEGEGGKAGGLEGGDERPKKKQKKNAAVLSDSEEEGG